MSDLQKRRIFEAWRFCPVQMMRDAGFEPDPHQIEYLECDDPQTLVLWPRQSGKSQTSAVKVLHQAYFDPGDVVILAGEKQKQAQEVYEKAFDLHHILKDKGAVPTVERSGEELEFGNGSRLLALPATVESIRGYAAKLALIDEAAFTPDNTPAKVVPMLSATGGRLIAASTPNGARGWFYHAWHEGQGWRRLTVTIDKLPRLSEKEIARQKDILTPNQFRQEFLLEWLDGDQQFFSTEVIEAAFDDTIQPLFAEDPTAIDDTIEPLEVAAA